MCESVQLPETSGETFSPTWPLGCARIATKLNATGLDLYGSHQIRREVFVMATEVAPGDSGGALVDAGGTVVGVAFAIAPDQSTTAYALSSTELRAVLAALRTAAGNTGPCLRG